jgi:hypothetical protein
MKMKITDGVAISKLSPIDTRHYLDANKWREKGRYGERAIRFEKATAEDTWEILLPISRSVADFGERMHDLIETLAAVEQRNELQVYHDLVASGADVLRLWAPEADDRGTIPLHQGARVCEQGLGMLTAAAKAENRTAKTFRPQNPRNVDEYIKTVRLGLTEPGSYVFPIISPVAPTLNEEPQQLALFNEVEFDPYSRRVMTRLDASLLAVRKAIEETIAVDDISPFEQAVDIGVSANLCDSVSKLIQDVDNVRISVSWSPGRPNILPNRQHKFGQDDRKILDEVVRIFRRNEPVEDARIFGLVVRTARSPDKLDGKVWVQVSWENRLRVVQVDLAHSDYEKSVDAHRRKLPLLVDGDIYKDGRNLILMGARNLKVVEEGEGGDLE